MRNVSKRITGTAIIVLGLGAASAAITPATAGDATQQMLLQQQEQQRQQAAYQQQQQQWQMQQQQQWQMQLQRQWQQQQESFGYGYGAYGYANPTLVGLAFWTGKPYTYWACELGVDFQCPATRAAAAHAAQPVATGERVAAPRYRHRSGYARHRVRDERAASR